MVAAADREVLVALAAGLVLILLLLLISLVVITLLWRRTGGHRRDVDRLRTKVDELEDLWAEAGARLGTGASTAHRSRGGPGGSPRPGGRSLDPPGPGPGGGAAAARRTMMTDRRRASEPDRGGRGCPARPPAQAPPAARKAATRSSQ